VTAALSPWDFYTLTGPWGTVLPGRDPACCASQTRRVHRDQADNLGLGWSCWGSRQVPWPTGLKLIAVWLLALFAGATVGQLLGGAVRHHLSPHPDPPPGGRVADERPFAIEEEDLGRDRRGGHP
jgi:hypothetical protein